MTGVLFEGGSFRPVFSCGVMDALLDADIMFPYCIGVSAGAANAASYISRQRERNIRVIERYRNDKRYFGKRNYLHDKSIFGIDFVFREIPNYIDPFDMETFKKYDGNFVIVTTDALTGVSRYFNQNDVDDTYNVFCASCALPIAFPAVTIDGREYYDGGLSNPIPIDKMINDGVDKMLIVLTRPKGYVKECNRNDRLAAGILKSRYPKIAYGLLNRYKKYNESIKICEKLEKEGKAIIIRPKTPVSSYETDTKVMRESYEKGYKLAQKKMDEIRELFEEK